MTVRLHIFVRTSLPLKVDKRIIQESRWDIVIAGRLCRSLSRRYDASDRVGDLSQGAVGGFVRSCAEVTKFHCVPQHGWKRALLSQLARVVTGQLERA